MFGVHTFYVTIISPTLISSEIYEWLYPTHSHRAHLAAFTHDLLKILAIIIREPNPCTRRVASLDLPTTGLPRLHSNKALERTFLTNAELIGSPLNCSMSGDVSYCSAFPEDEIFGAMMNSFLYRWTAHV